MQRIIWIILLVALGLVFIACGLLVPAHLRAVDAAVIEQAGIKSPSLTDEAAKLISLEKMGPAQLLSQVAREEKVRGQETVDAALRNFSVTHPELLIWGGAAPYLEKLFQPDRNSQPLIPQPILEVVMRSENRQRLLETLQDSRRPSVGEILKVRSLTNTVHFPPAGATAGRALDSILVLTGLLLQGDHFTPALQDELLALAQKANRTRDSLKLEEALLDILSLGKRMNWNQLTLFVSRIEDLLTLRNLAFLIRTQENQLPVVFAAVHLSGKPGVVSSYLMRYKDSAFKDVRYSLGKGSGGLEELLKRKAQIHYPAFRQRVVEYDPFGAFFYAILDWCRRAPWATLALKYLFYLAGGFYLARTYPYWRPSISTLEQPLQVPDLAPARQSLMALFFLLVMVFLSEPFLVQESQQVEIPLRLQLPRLASVIPPGATKAIEPLMNRLSIVSLLIFFSIQALVYSVCLLKLAEIRRQGIGPRLKLRLLENEEHLFDAGLYLGFVGTIIALILMTAGVVTFSLMAGYSSTSFGIIFVSVLKIFHVRPLRRRLILESETTPA